MSNPLTLLSPGHCYSTYLTLSLHLHSTRTPFHSLTQSKIKMDSTEKALTASCHCRSVQFTLSVPTDVLPLDVHLCHCSICRHTHGTPCIFHARLPSGVEPKFIPPSSMAQLTSYRHSDSISTKYFCSTCGCHIGDQNDDSGKWVISNALFDANKEDTNIWKFKTHLHPGSTTDGGLASMIPTIEGRDMEMVDPEQPTVSHTSPEDGSSKDELLAQCHCGGVSFKIARPSPGFVASPDGQVWLSSVDKSKWLACLDTCDDCRLVNGTHVIGWMFVPVSHLSPTPSSNLIIGSSKAYRSTAEVLRTFCGRCGATVFYNCDERPGIVDIATGILRDPEGVMVENWVLWRAGRVSWAENGLRYHAGFTAALMEGMKEWGNKRGQLQDFTIP